MARPGFYPGSFDPLTYGHLDVIARAARLVDRLVIAVGVHHGKQGMLTLEARMAVLETATRKSVRETIENTFGRTDPRLFNRQTRAPWWTK